MENNCFFTKNVIIILLIINSLQMLMHKVEYKDTKSRTRSVKEGQWRKVVFKKFHVVWKNSFVNSFIHLTVQSGELGDPSSQRVWHDETTTCEGSLYNGQHTEDQLKSPGCGLEFKHLSVIFWIFLCDCFFYKLKCKQLTRNWSDIIWFPVSWC